jgi:hypothetical protein
LAATWATHSTIRSSLRLLPLRRRSCQHIMIPTT